MTIGQLSWLCLYHIQWTKYQQKIWFRYQFDSGDERVLQTLFLESAIMIKSYYSLLARGGVNLLYA